MLIALHHLERIRASPRTIAICPECKEEVVPKCGKIKVWHWAHHANSNCKYGEGMGLWHLRWQDFALQNGADVEVPIMDARGNIRRADIVYDNRVIELQHSGISVDEIIQRSDFYVGQKYKVDWIIDYTKKEFIEVESDHVTLSARHKKSFNCLFHKLYGKIIFNLGTKLFVANKIRVEKEWDVNDFGSRYKQKYVFYGYYINNIFTLQKVEREQAFFELAEQQ
jgi:competence CoiA-like predicted nuclease